MPYDLRFIDVVQSTVPVVGFDGATKPANKVGSLPVTICDKHGRQLFDAKICGVRHVPGSTCGLFSMGMMQHAGCTLSSDSNKIVVTKDGHCI